MLNASFRRIPRTGLTLVELLVVVVILVMLVAVTVPMMRPMLEGREMREAARQLNGLLGAAQARAVARGRPVGVMLHRRGDNQSAAFQLSLAEVPPPYAGDSAIARAFSTTNDPWQAALTYSWAAATLVAPGDFIKFDYRGALYPIVSLNQLDNTVVQFAPPSSAPSAPPPPLLPEFNPTTGQQNPGVPFQIYRAPQRTPAAPLELPTPAVVDLLGCGIGATGIGTPQFVDPTVPVSPNVDNSVIILFSPSGRVDRVYVNGRSDPPVGPIHLLVGRVDQVGLANLQDSKNLWVTIGHRTGHITTSPNYGQQITSLEQVAVARQFALRGQSMGGR
jgi:type II secretory pathway pseudopilin PulG